MGKIFGDVKGKEQLTPRESVLNRYNSSRASLLFCHCFYCGKYDFSIL